MRCASCANGLRSAALRSGDAVVPLSPYAAAHATARYVPVDYVAAGLLASASALIGNARWSLATPSEDPAPSELRAQADAFNAGSDQV